MRFGTSVTQSTPFNHLFRRDGLDALQAAYAQQQRPAPAPRGRRAQSAAPAPDRAPEPPHVAYLVGLLALCEASTLAAIQQASGTQQLRLLYKALRASRFLSAMEEDMRERERKLEEMVAQSFQPQRRVLSEEEAEGFYQRLLADAAKRQAKRCVVPIFCVSVHAVRVSTGRHWQHMLLQKLVYIDVQIIMTVYM